MSVTIESLDIQIRSSAGSAAQNIEALANALGKLNANSKLTTTVNNLAKLNSALSAMKSQTSTMSHLTALSKSLSGLASIPELTGLKSAIKELKKLPEVMAQLNASDISRFTAKMKLLASGLGPLATQIDKIGRGFSKLPPQVSKCVTAVKRLDSANKSAAKSTKAHGAALGGQSFNLLAAYENMSNVFGMIHGIQDGIGKLMDDAIQWDGIQFRFGRAFGEDADMVLEYARKVSDELKINMQQFMQYSSLYGSLLSGFGMAQKQVTTISVGLTELSYDIWAAYNDRYRTLEEASEAVRSAITGEIEPIRNAGIALTEASMQEYLDSIGMASVSIEKLTEAQKAEVRYAVMVDAAMKQGIVGTYAREMQTAEGAVRTLTQQLKTLGQAFGSLFIPVLQKVIPWLSAFVELITEGLAALGAMFGIKFQEIQWGDQAGMKQTAAGAETTADALGEAAKNAKAMKDYAMGFDELNVINPSSSSGSGAGSAEDVGGGSLGLDLDTLWDDSVFASASKQVDALKEKILDIWNEWKTEISVVSGALSLLGVGKLLTHLGEAIELGDTFLGTISKIKGLAVGAIVITLQYTLATEFLKSYLDGGEFKNYIAAMFVNALGTWVMYSKFGTTGLVIGLTVTALTSLSAIIDDGGIKGTEGAITAMTGIASAAAAVGVVLKKTDLGAAIKLWFSGEKLSGVLAAMFPSAANVLSTATQWVTKTFAPALGQALKAVVGIIAKHPVILAIIAAIVAVILTVAHWDKVKAFFTETLPQWFSAAGEAISGFFSSAWDKVKEIWNVVATWFDENVIQPLVNFFAPIVEWIGEFFRGCWMIVRAVWVVVSTWFNEKVVQPIVKFFSGLWTSVSGFFSQLWEDIKGVWDVVSGWFNETVVEPVVGWFEGAWLDIKGFFSKLWTDVKGIWQGVANWFDIQVVQPVVGFFEDAWDTIKAAFEMAFNGIQNFAVNIINGLIGGVERMINWVIDGINGLVGGFNNVVSWAADVLGENWGGLTILKRVELGRLEIEAKANGGFVSAGQMFIARESGPELVGNINGRTAVANNDQIVAAVAQGVYEAVAAAMGASRGSGGQNINVYLDGKQIYASVKKRDSERGMQLIGDQLGYAY